MSEQFEPSMEEIAGLVISPQTDLPFGKPFRMGLAQYTIYESATEKGYQAGVQTHLDFIKDHGHCAPVMLDEAGFSLIFAHEMPPGMSEQDTSNWRAHFIAGWASVYLGLVREVWEWFDPHTP